MVYITGTDIVSLIEGSVILQRNSTVSAVRSGKEAMEHYKRDR